MKILKIIAIHGSFLVFIAAAIAALASVKTVDIDIGEGDSPSALHGPVKITLSGLDIAHDAAGSASVSSFITVSGPEGTSNLAVGINSPAFYRGTGIYQKGYYIGFKKLGIVFGGKSFFIKDPDTPVTLNDGSVLYIRPYELKDGILSYYYEIFNKNGEASGSGVLSRMDLNNSLSSKYGLRISAEEYRAVSNLRIVESPFSGLLGLSAAAFLVLNGLFIFIPLKGKEK